MTMMYDKEKHDALVAQEAVLSTSLQESSVILNDLYATDDRWDKDRLSKYQVEQMRHSQITREREIIRGQLSRMEVVQPASKKAELTPFMRFLKQGENGLASDEIDEHIIVNEMGEKVFRVKVDGPQFAPTRSDNETGQNATDDMVDRSLLDSLSAYGGVAKCVYRFNTEDGNKFIRPQIDTSDQRGVILAAQNTPAGQQDLPNVGRIEFEAYTATSQQIDLTREMIQDNVVNIEAYIRGAIIRRLGRIWDFAYTIGNGAGNANAPGGHAGVNSIFGIVPSAADGITSASATGFTWEELVDLEHSVDAAYLDGTEHGEGGFMAESGGKTGFLMSRQAEAVCKKMKDADNRPLWIPSIREGQPNMMTGWPYEVAYNMDAVTANKKPIMFGNFSYYAIRQINEVDIFRFFDSGTAGNNVVRYLAYNRRDARPIGAYVNPGTTDKCEAYRVLTTAAS